MKPLAIPPGPAKRPCGLSSTLAIPIPVAPAPSLTLRRNTSSEEAWANGREEIELVATVIDAGGRGVAGRTIFLGVDATNGVAIAPTPALIATDM